MGGEENDENGKNIRVCGVCPRMFYNRFTGLQVGVYARSGSSCTVLAGNAFESCARALSAVDSKGAMIVDHGDIVRGRTL